jgi:hypothetical protein
VGTRGHEDVAPSAQATSTSPVWIPWVVALFVFVFGFAIGRTGIVQECGRSPLDLSGIG